MELVPLAYIILLGLTVSLINTIIYGVYVIKNTNQKTLPIIVFIVGLLGFFVVGIVSCYYIITMIGQINSNVGVKTISDTYRGFSLFVTICTYVVFSIFAVLDFLYGYVKKFSGNSLDKKIAQLQLYLIDIPVIIGCICINIFVSKLDSTLMSPEISSNFLFANIFTAGAWGLQLIYSQIIFLALMIIYFFWSKNEKNTNDATSVQV